MYKGLVLSLDGVPVPGTLGTAGWGRSFSPHWPLESCLQVDSLTS